MKATLFTLRAHLLILFILCLCLLQGNAWSQGSVPKFLFTANYVDGTISVFSVEPLTGQLTEVPGSPFPGGYAIQGMALTPDNKFLYTGGISVNAFSVNRQTGRLTPIATYSISGGLGGVTITPNGEFLYATGSGIYGFSIDAGTGELTAVPGSPVDPAVDFAAAAADPTSQFLYAPALIPNQINGYAIQEDGEIFPLTGSPYFDSSSPFDVVAEPSGRFVYVVNYGGGISGFAIAPQQGILTPLPGSPYSTGGDAPNSIAASADGRAIIVDNQVESTTASLAIEPDGSLALAGTPQPSGLNPRNVTVDPTSEFVYTSATGASTVSAYRLDPVSLALEPVPGLQWPTGSNPYELVATAGPRPPYCPLNNVEPSVTLCAPTTTSPSPVRILAGTTSASAVQELTVLVDGTRTFSNADSNAMDVSVDIPSGTHTLTVQAKNAAGQKFSVVRSITVSGSDTASCGSRGVLPTVAICAPLAGSVTETSTHVVSESFGFGVIASTAVYVDNVEVYSVSSGSVDTYVNVAPGRHSITVSSVDTTGFQWSSTVYVSAK